MISNWFLDKNCTELYGEIVHDHSNTFLMLIPTVTAALLAVPATTAATVIAAITRE